MKFFVTGNGFDEAGAYLKFITPAGVQSGNFASRGQTLQQSFSVVESVFNLVERGTINFVLITLTPDALFRNGYNFPPQEVFGINVTTLDSCINLCRENGAKPVVVIFPVAPAARKGHWLKILDETFNTLAELKKIRDFDIVNLVDMDLADNYFADNTHLNDSGAVIAGVFLTLQLCELGIFTDDDFCRMNYDYFHLLSQVTDKNSFNSVMDEMFSLTLAKLRRKEKIRVAFVTDHAAMWCGDKLYNLFAENPRFETTVFLCRGKESTLEKIRHDFAQFKAAGINVVGVFDKSEETPPQDIIFFLRPYFAQLSASFQLSVLTPQTLMIYIPYGYGPSMTTALLPNYYNYPLFRLVWKYFFDTEKSKTLFNRKGDIGVPRGIVSGEPKMDFFYEDLSKIKFPWKMTRPDAKKIIWAPHHSFTKKDIASLKSTFPHNFRFMYEFAKAHPEISWVVKPHPRLAKAAVEAGLFPSENACEDYLRQWDALPNAQVYMGAYYQAIFATSDGMIHDSISFIAEYQYTHKPMIFLVNNEREEFTDLGIKILNESYLVDGKNPDAIAAAIEKIFIEGNDPLKDARRKVFDECLNYYKLNGMSASDFIFKTVAEELQII